MAGVTVSVPGPPPKRRVLVVESGVSTTVEAIVPVEVLPRRRLAPPGRLEKSMALVPPAVKEVAPVSTRRFPAVEVLARNPVKDRFAVKLKEPPCRDTELGETLEVEGTVPLALERDRVPPEFTVTLLPTMEQLETMISEPPLIVVGPV